MIVRALSRLLPLWLAVAACGVAADETTCMTTTRRYADDASVLHFVCFCDSPRQVSVGEHVHRDDYFSLADFAYNLSGAIFTKAIAISFQSCRFLRVLLDQSELTRIGSPYFRPDIAVRAIDAEHVYHLDLRRNVSPAGSEFLNTPAQDVNIGVRSVALVSVDRGAKFGSLHTNSNSTVLYIDLNESAGDEELNVQGFSASHVYFVTSTKEEVPLKEGEDLQAKMRSLSVSPARSTYLSLALSLSTIVILLGIVGLIVVANHRQKKRRRLKAAMSAKSLVASLDSRKIATEVGDKLTARIRHTSKSSRASRATSRASGRLPMNTADIEEQRVSSRQSLGGRRKMDFNELISGIMYRMRKPEPAANDWSALESGTDSHAGSVKNAKQPPASVRETSFYYKESSVTPSDSSGTSGTSGSSGSDTSGGFDNPSYGDVTHETVEVAVDKAVKAPIKSAVPSSSSSSSSSDDERSQAGSYVSKISQKVFVNALPPAPPALPPHSRPRLQPPDLHRGPPVPAKSNMDFQGELKEKCMTFFSSVSKTRKDAPINHNSKL